MQEGYSCKKDIHVMHEIAGHVDALTAKAISKCHMFCSVMINIVKNFIPINILMNWWSCINFSIDFLKSLEISFG